ncbi:YcxB family protein [Streptomyces sp. KLOTTS4A1]|uniref:YcxB family protein n=1 Tax=Streptomyces sp. KLOTTS4A1 TaxID=3390996 RepID=UPI0039F52C9D
MSADVEPSASAPAVELEFLVAEVEFWEALRAISRWPRTGDVQHIPMLFGVTLIVAGAAYLPEPLNGASILALAPFGAMLGSVYDWLRLRRAVRALRRWQVRQGVCSVRVDEVGVHGETATSSGTARWAAFTQCRETENLFVLSAGDRGDNLCVLPKRGVLSTGGVERLRELTGRHVAAAA